MKLSNSGMNEKHMYIYIHIYIQVTYVANKDFEIFVYDKSQISQHSDVMSVEKQIWYDT